MAAGASGDSAARLVAEVSKITGARLVLSGVARHGESGGAVYVRWPDGRPGVVTRSLVPVARMRRTAEVLAAARAHGLPVPRHELVVQLGDGTTAVVQERLPGAPARRIDHGVVDAMVAMNERFAGLLAGCPDVPVPVLDLGLGERSSYDETLGGYNERGRGLLNRIRAVGDGAPRELTGDDLVHTDYTLGNVLYDKAGRITGVVDWNTGGVRGDRQFALIKLRIDLSWDRHTYLTVPDLASYQIEQPALERLDEILTTLLDPTLARAYWGHWILQHAHWAIQARRDPETVKVFLTLGERHLY